MSDARELDVPTLCEVLRIQRRRWAIEEVAERGRERVTLRELSDWIAAREYGPTYSGDERKRVYVGIYQSHADQFADAGILVHTEDGLRRGPHFETARNALDALDALIHDDSAESGVVDRVSGLLSGVSGR